MRQNKFKLNNRRHQILEIIEDGELNHKVKIENSITYLIIERFLFRSNNSKEQISEGIFELICIGQQKSNQKFKNNETFRASLYGIGDVTISIV